MDFINKDNINKIHKYEGRHRAHSFECTGCLCLFHTLDQSYNLLLILAYNFNNHFWNNN